MNKSNKVGGAGKATPRFHAFFNIINSLHSIGDIIRLSQKY
jgi:hypothetical protein